MAKDIEPSGYRCVAASIEGFIQQVAVSYIRTGHFFYVSGMLGESTDGSFVDAKLIRKYGVDVSRWGRALRKSRGEANLQYIRHDRFFLLMATHGKSLFFELEGEQVSDCRRQPIKFAGYSISYRGGHPHVRIDLETYRGFKAQMVGEALRRERDQLERMLSTPLWIPYAPVRRQMWNVCREMNRVRSAAGLPYLRPECMNARRRIVRPFGDVAAVQAVTGVTASGSGFEVGEMSEDVDWDKLNGPGTREQGSTGLVGVPRQWKPEKLEAKPVEPEHAKPEPGAEFPEAWGRVDDDRDAADVGLGSLWPTDRPRGPGKGRDPGR
ncbi:MAG: hypothetical protein IPM33_02050 [Phycisphaerales bacterium]|nr:hypothetical protein [Phycisphaerales bacterium]